MEVASERVDVVAVTYRTRQVGEQKDATKFEVLNRLVRGLIKTGNENSGFGAAPVERV
jgi:hypothetical protein